MDARDISESIRRQCRTLNLRPSELADFSEISERFIRDLEKGKTTVRLDKLLQILAALGLRLEITGNNPLTNSNQAPA